MSEDRNILSLREQRELLDCIAMFIIGLLYSKIPDEVSKAPRWRVNYHDKQAILIINFDWWLPFEDITIKQIKSAIIVALRGNSVELGEEEHNNRYDFLIYLKNGQKITIGRYESTTRNSDHSIVITI